MHSYITICMYVIHDMCHSYCDIFICVLRTAEYVVHRHTDKYRAKFTVRI